jgi:DNA-binding beta-propeller fold protein YncE
MAQVYSVAYSPDGRRIVSGGGEDDRSTRKTFGELKVWDAATGQNLLTLKGHMAQVFSVAYSPDGRRIVSGGFGNDPRTRKTFGELKVWEAATGRNLLTLKGHTGNVWRVAYSPDGKRIVSGGGELKVWDAATGQNLLSLKGHTWGVSSVAYSPDGRRIVSGSWDKTLKVWDAATGQELLTLKGHTGYVLSVAYSPDGRRIVSGGGDHDNTVKVWDSGMSEDLLFLKGHSNDVTSVAFSPDGKRVFARDERGKVLAWDAATGMLLLDPPARILPGRRQAVHGKLRASLDGPLVRLQRILTPDEQQRLAREEERHFAASVAREFHAAEAAAAEKDRQFFAAVFHLDRLLPLLPNERADLLQRRHAVLAAALKANASDPWAVRALARQAVSDPASIPGRDTLLSLRATLARQQDAPNDRLHGALLLRTGSAREAILVLRAARNKRGPDVAPVEELLLALAHLRLDQPAEARKHLQTAVAWTERGPAPVRATTLAGLVVRGPLPALGALVISPPDPRRTQIDYQTTHELTALRAEVEKALAALKP